MMTNDLFLALIAVGIAGMLRGFAGFGAGMVLVPSLSLIYNPQTAVVTAVLMEMIPAIQLLPGSVRRCHWQSVLPMALAASFTIPLGAMLLVSVDADAMRIAIAVLVLLCVTVLATGWRYNGSGTRKAAVITGLSSGMITGAMGLGGLPVVFYYLSARHSAAVARGSIVLFLVFTAVISLLTYLGHGIVHADTLRHVLLFAPVFIFAIWLGERCFGKVSDTMFRAVTLSLLAGVGLMTLTPYV
jgi:uncharacterized membrane protein YfcA